MQRKPFVIGIAGGSASGKSTFTRELLRILPAYCPDTSIVDVHTDRYFRAGSPDMPTFVSPSSGKVTPHYNHPDSIDAQRLVGDLDALCAADDAPGLIIVEGHFVLHYAELRERLNLSVFIELDADARALRRMVRNLEHHGDPIIDQSPESIAAYFLESAKPGHEQYIEPSRVHADLVLRGDADFTRTAPMLAAVIADQMKKS